VGERRGTRKRVDPNDERQDECRRQGEGDADAMREGGREEKQCEFIDSGAEVGPTSGEREEAAVVELQANT
jgi:hypothetical protein